MKLAFSCARGASASSRFTPSFLFVLSVTLVAATAASSDALAQSECAPNWELDGELCYPACPHWGLYAGEGGDLARQHGRLHLRPQQSER